MQDIIQNIDKAILESIEIKTSLRQYLISIASAIQRISNRVSLGGKVYLIGNGGSAADCQHIAADFLGKFSDSDIPIPAIALTTDTSVLTAFGNDFGYEKVFSSQIRGLLTGQDILIAISTSGNSENIIEAVKQAKEQNVFVIGFLGGNGGRVLPFVDLPLIVPSDSTPRIQECHILIGHIICELVKQIVVKVSHLG